ADDALANYTLLSGQHVGAPPSPYFVTLPPVDHFSNTFLGGLLDAIFRAIGVSAILDHFRPSYAQALANEGLITSSQLASFLAPTFLAPTSSGPSETVVEDLSEIYPNIANVTMGTDASGNVVESGTVTVATSIGTAVATISEAVSPAGVT